MMNSLKDIVEVFAKHKSQLQSRFKIKEIGIFGSFVRGFETPKSDLDILVDFDKGGETFDNYMELKFFLEGIFNTKVDLVIRHVLRPELKHDILAEVVYV